ncbi:MAG: Hpt domain-containing protein [Clostridia bacterium]|nr:Hpt domain-containing protein [Clostridia bacterium]
MQEFEGRSEIEGLDVKKGLQHTGTWQLYTKLLSVFAGAIERRAELFRSMCESGDIDAYRVEVHSLKSNARTIGADTLGVLAEQMENKCLEKDLDYIRKNTPALLDEYEKFIPILAPYKKAEPVVDWMAAVERDTIMELCARILTALDDFDIDRAEVLVKTLLSYKMEPALEKMLALLKDAVENYAYERAEEVTRDLMSKV